MYILVCRHRKHDWKIEMPFPPDFTLESAKTMVRRMRETSARNGDIETPFDLWSEDSQGNREKVNLLEDQT
jgi:hypothetical protein